MGEPKKKIYATSWLLLLERGHGKWLIACLHGVEFREGLVCDGGRVGVSGGKQERQSGERKGERNSFQNKHKYLVTRL